MNKMVRQKPGRFIGIGGPAAPRGEMAHQQSKRLRFADEAPAALPIDHIDMGIDLLQTVNLRCAARQMPRRASLALAVDRYVATRSDPMVDDMARLRASPLIADDDTATTWTEPSRFHDGPTGFFRTRRNAGERMPQWIAGACLGLKGQCTGDKQERAGKGTRQTEAGHGTPRISTGVDALAKCQTNHRRGMAPRSKRGF